jgi:hypothetical protein
MRRSGQFDVGRDRDRALLIGGGDEAEEVVGGDAIQGGEAEIVDHDEVVAQEPLNEPPDGVVRQAAVERLDQLIGLKEADLLAGGDRGSPEPLGQMTLADAARAGQAEVLLAIKPLEAGEEVERGAWQL